MTNKREEWTCTETTTTCDIIIPFTNDRPIYRITIASDTATNSSSTPSNYVYDFSRKIILIGDRHLENKIRKYNCLGLASDDEYWAIDMVWICQRAWENSLDIIKFIELIVTHELVHLCTEETHQDGGWMWTRIIARNLGYKNLEKYLTKRIKEEGYE